MADGSSMVFFSTGLTRSNAMAPDGLVYTASKVRKPALCTTRS